MRRATLSGLAALAVSLITAAAAAAASPTIAVLSPSGVGTNAATVRATITPGGAATYYRVEYGLTAASYTNASPVLKLSSSTRAVTVSVKLGGLAPGTDYHYRVDALNRNGGAASSDHTVKTTGHPPADAVSGGATVQSDSSAYVTAIVNPHGQSTGYYFEYWADGVSPLLATRTAPMSLAASSQPAVVSAVLTGLAAGTVFHFQVVAVHSGSGGSATTTGGVVSFLTFPDPAHKRAPHVASSTGPRWLPYRPFVLTTTGHLTAPAGIPPWDGCPQAGRLTIVYGRHRLADQIVEVGADCRFSASTRIGRLPRQPRGRHHRVIVRVYIHFSGNGYVQPSQARMVNIRLGLR